MSNYLRRDLNVVLEKRQLAAARGDKKELERLLKEEERLRALIEREEGQTAWGVSAVTAEAIREDFQRYYGDRSDLTSSNPRVAGSLHKEQKPISAWMALALFLGSIFCVIMAFAAWLADKG